MIARRTLVLAAAALLAPGAMAQWSTDSGSNLSVADRSGEQVQAKIRPTADGGCYISWFDNSTGGYDVYLQRLNKLGVEQWAHNGILLCDRGVSSTVDYDLIVDADGNAVITYNDDHLTMGGAQQISVQKVSPGGEKLWGDFGVMLTDSTEFKGNPRVVALADGSYVAGWSSGSPQTWTMVKLDAEGDQLWSTNINEPSRYLALSDFKPTPDGFIALWVRGSTASASTSSKALYTQKFDASGSPLWNSGSPVIVFNTTSVQNGYFPTFLSDGEGGGIYGWYEIGGSRNAYIQHVNSDGTFRFASPIANSVVTSRIRISAGLAYDDVGGNYYLSSTESNAGAQGNYSVIVNKISGEGDRLWGDGGVTVVPTGTSNQSAFVQTVALGEDCVVAGIDSRSATTDIIFAARVNGDQSIPWSILPSSTVVDKARLAMTQSHCGDVLLAWTNGASSSGDVQAQNIRVGGMLGRTCEADFDGDGFITGQDFDAFVGMFEAGDLCADFDNDGFLTGIDYDAYVQAFEAGC